MPSRVAAGSGEGLPLRPADWVITTMATLGSAYLLLAARWVPGAVTAGLAFALLAAGPATLRALARRFPRLGFLDVVASFWLLPTVGLAHCSLGPVVDALHPRLFDGVLARMDVVLLGNHAGVLLDHWVPPALMDLLLACYYSYFFWPAALGVLIFRRLPRAQYDEYLLALSLFFGANFLLYVAVPAIGPRFFLAEAFSAPLNGVVIVPYLDSMLRTPPFLRDCFPSGHTGVTLMVLVFAYRYQRRFFWLMLGPAVGLILATVAGRFHYVVDLMAALPLLLAVLGVTGAVARLPGRVPEPRRAFRVRSPVEI
jgi:hypothetical protein